MLLSMFGKNNAKSHEPGSATLRATSIAFTIFEVVVVAAAAYHMWQGNAIPLAFFSVLAVAGLFVTASAWGTDLDRRREPTVLSPHDLHDLTEVDYANLMRESHTSMLVLTLRNVEPYVTIEAVNNGYASDWLVRGESMFEAYVKAWVQTHGDGNTSELRY